MFSPASPLNASAPLRAHHTLASKSGELYPSLLNIAIPISKLEIERREILELAQDFLEIINA